MGLIDVEKAIARLGRALFSTREIAAMSGDSPSAAIQSLARLEEAGLVRKVKRGLWQDARRDASPFDVVPHLSPSEALYVSFTSALHLHGMVSQIPQIVTAAALSHSRTVRTAVGAYRIHQLCRELFGGYGWYKGNGGFLIASPAKALVDCLYISARKGKAYASFPELDLSSVDAKEARRWVLAIPSPQVRKRVMERIKELLI